MKWKLNNIAYYFLITVVSMSLQSCAIMGLTVGSRVDKKDKYNYDVPIIEGKGWVQPPSNKCNLELMLTSGKSIYGRNQGLVNNEIWDHPQLMKIQVDKTEKLIPDTYINFTKIYRVKKNGSKTGLMVGIGLDVAAILAFIISGDPIVDPIGNSLKWN